MVFEHMESPVGALFSSLRKDSKKVGYSELPLMRRDATLSFTGVTSWHMVAEQWAPRTPTLARQCSPQATLEELGARVQAVCGGEPCLIALDVV